MIRSSSRLALVAAVALLPLAACQTAEKAATTVQSAAQAQTTPTLSTTDATFLNLTGTSGANEIKLGQLAETKAASPAVRRYARDMVNDHTAANAQLISLAQSKQFSPSSTTDTAHDQLYSTLQGLRGHAFDKAYMDAQVQDHQAVVESFNTEIQGGTDPDVKAFAQKNLPMMQRHLQMAQRLDPRR